MPARKRVTAKTPAMMRVFCVVGELWGISHIISACGRIEARFMVYASVKTTDNDVKIKLQRSENSTIRKKESMKKKVSG